MELKDTAKKILDIFEVQSMEQLPSKVTELLLKDGKNDYLQQYLDIVGIEGRDMLQSAYQFWLADRANKKQDYTPKSLGELLAAIGVDEAKTVFDACAGSGALTIACWERNQKLNFVCFELDERAIGFLLLNLAVRNISATVIHGDLLTGEIFRCYKVSPGEKFSYIEVIGTIIPECDLVISNPPFNMKWKAEPIVFNNKIIQLPESNANYAFILKALIKADTNKGIFILPAGAIRPNSYLEMDCRDLLASDGFIKAVIYNAGEMFESTSVKTLCLVIEPNSDNITFVDNSENFTISIREQRGEDHMSNRVYKKEIKIYDENCIKRVIDAIKKEQDIPGFCNTVTNEVAIMSQFNRAEIIDRAEIKIEHRNIKDIVNDLNRIYEEKNKLKLTVNESVAKKYNLLEVANLQLSENNFKDINQLLKKLGADELAGDKYLTLSKNAGEFKFENKNKKDVSTIIEQILPLYKQHLRFLNNCESQYLKELQSVLITLLMSGEVDL